MRLEPDVEERHSADRGGDASIVRRGRERVAAIHRRPERRDARGIDTGQRARERDGRAPVVQLARGMEQVRLARAVSEPAMVEQQRGDARSREALGERAQPIAARPGQAMRHDDDGCRSLALRGGIEPGGAGVGPGGEDDVSAAHAPRNPGAWGNVKWCAGMCILRASARGRAPASRGKRLHAALPRGEGGQSSPSLDQSPASRGKRLHAALPRGEGGQCPPS